jgi:hypothetical protein
VRLVRSNTPRGAARQSRGGFEPLLSCRPQAPWGQFGVTAYLAPGLVDGDDARPCAGGRDHEIVPEGGAFGATLANRHDVGIDRDRLRIRRVVAGGTLAARDLPRARE